MGELAGDDAEERHDGRGAVVDRHGAERGRDRID
jgi:hypothetical protein